MSGKKTISILGCGWFGIPMAESLIKAGHHVKGSTRTKEKLTLLQSKNIEPFLIDLENLADNISEFLDSDVLIIATTCKQIEAKKQLILYLEQAPLKQTIFISSTSVYPLINRVVTENDTTTDSVLANIEREFLSNIHLTPTIIRFSGLIGPKRNPARFFRNGKTVKHPLGYVNLIHLTDCINITNHVINAEIRGDIFNACSDKHSKRIDFYTELAKRNQYPIPEFQNPETIQYKIVSNEKVKTTFDYQFVYPNPLEIPLEAYK